MLPFPPSPPPPHDHIFPRLPPYLRKPMVFTMPLPNLVSVVTFIYKLRKK